MLSFDICICTRNRPEALAKCIRSVLASAIRPAKIIVSDDSSDQRTRDLIDTEFPDALYLVGPKKGLGANRNCALRDVSAELTSFLDDDAMLAPDFFQSAFQFAHDRGLDPLQAILTGVEMKLGKSVGPKDQDFLGFQSRSYGIDDELNTLVINSAVIPSWLAKKIGFDELLIYGSDEVDFAIRARSEGIKILFCPYLMNAHFPSTINREYYSPFTDASRIYVTFKRYVILEKNILKAILYVFIASGHLLAACVRRFGLMGFGRAAGSLRKAYGFIFIFLARSGHDPKRCDS